MDDKLGLGPEPRELKLGQSFTNPKASAFHAIRYDFKPASVDLNKIATVDVGNNNQVTVTVPHLDGAGVPQTVFKGSQRPFQKECVLIIDRITGEITLEKLSSNIQVKKTRSEAISKIMHHLGERNSQNVDKSTTSSTSNSGGSSGRPQTPPMVGQRSSSRTKVTSGARKPERQITHLVPKHSPLHASPNYNNTANSSLNSRSPKRPIDLHSMSNDNHNSSVLASVPSLVDDYMDHTPPPPHMTLQSRTVSNHHPTQHHQVSSNTSATFDKSPAFHIEDNGVEEMTDSSSSSSSSDSDSDPDRTEVSRSIIPPPNTHRNNTNGYHNSSNNSSHNRNSNSSAKLSSMPSPNVYEDLQLSEDSD